MNPYGRHFIDQEDIDAVVRVLKSDWLTCGPNVGAFETKLRTIVAADYAVACSNGTTALHLAFLALGIGNQDVIIVTAINFLASANVARYVNSEVIFADVDPCTGLMTADTLENAIIQNKHKALKAVVNVHLAGQCENLEAIHNVAKKYGLWVIEDAAHALGTIYKAFSDVTTFSFHPVKTLTTGEGGAVTTNNPEVAKKMQLLRSHGMVREPLEWICKDQGMDTSTNANPWYYEMQELGYNYRISDINCALGLTQLAKLDFFKNKRSELVDYYDNAFEKNHLLKPLKKLPCSDTCWHLYVLLIDFQQLGKSRAEVMNTLKEKGIGTQVHYIPLYKQPYYRDLYGDAKLPGAETYYSSCLSLPLYVGLQTIEQENIIKAF
jgi:UDP-4-amino-4,6-dideoxy-N-acetyl-beta-L-altrosamine transaminase